MCVTCYHVANMSKMIQLRNVPDEVHTKLKVRAAREGISLSELLVREATTLANTLTIEEISERIRQRGPGPNISAERLVQMIREDRGR